MGRAGAGRVTCSSRMPDGGFSLVEVMVAMGIFLIVSAATLGLILRATTTVRDNADRVYAAALARTEVDSLRALGATDVTLGAETRVVETDAGPFTVTRTSTWVDIGATTNPCDVGPGVVPGKSYIRVQVEVTGGDLEAPQRVDAIVYPRDTAPTQNTGTITVAVNDDAGEPVPGVTVSGANGAGGTFQQMTGPDGCVFAPDLVAGTTWVVTISRAGFITESPSGTVSNGIVVDELENTPVDFAYAAPGSLVVSAGGAGFPVPAGMPFQFTPDTLSRAPSSFGSFPVTVDGLWPDQYTGWLRPCATSTDGTSAAANLDAGGTATLDLGGTRIELVGPEDARVSAVYDGPCAATYPIGDWNDSLLQKTALPAGRWTFEVIGATPATKTILLTPDIERCSITWNVPGAIGQEPEPTPTASEEPTPTPSESGEPSAEPTPSPTPSIVLPEVSDPCPKP